MPTSAVQSGLSYMTCISTEEQLPISRPSLLPSPLLLKPQPAIPLLHVLSDPVQILMSTNIALIKKVGRAYKKAQEELQPYVTPKPQYGQHVFDHYPQTVATAPAPAGSPPMYHQADWGPAPPFGSYPPPHPGGPPAGAPPPPRPPVITQKIQHAVLKAWHLFWSPSLSGLWSLP